MDGFVDYTPETTCLSDWISSHSVETTETTTAAADPSPELTDQLSYISEQLSLICTILCVFIIAGVCRFGYWLMHNLL